MDKARADTPACEGQAFLDNAGSALSPTVVNDAVIDHLRLEQQVGGYVAAEVAGQQIWQSIANVGELINVAPANVALATSATAAWLKAVASLPFESGDRVLITSAEYASNIIPILQIAKSISLSVEVIPDGDDGSADPAALAEMLDQRVKAVVITHAPSQNGLITDAAAIGRVIQDSPWSPWYLLDACQSIGQLPVDMPAIGADFISATSRKWLRGPRGAGFLAVSDRVLAELEPHPVDMCGAVWDGDLGYTVNESAMRYQSFETSYACVLGLGAAVAYAQVLGIDAIRERIDVLASELRLNLAKIPGVRVVDRGTVQSGIVAFALADGDPFALTAELRGRGVTVTPMGPATNPRDFARFGSSCVLRASPHIYNTSHDLDALCSALTDVRD